MARPDGKSPFEIGASCRHCRFDRQSTPRAKGEFGDRLHLASCLYLPTLGPQVLNNEIHQYKGQVDQLTQLSERLVSSYPHDDTTRAVRINDNLSQRYSALHTGYLCSSCHR